MEEFELVKSGIESPKKVRTFDSFVRKMSECPKGLQDKCKINFMFEAGKAYKKILLDASHYKKEFTFMDITCIFLGFFDNETCLAYSEQTGYYYETNLNFIQNGFDLFYINLATKEPIRYKKSELIFESKKIKRMVNPKKEMEEINE